ncbi:SMI1/KNR4 family protein [Telmatocola sphagniphila]|uniref:SMI1/KNR4 family protein n=1 Tax=Telmatocola sphagniphila TaxID=1123043 RepID=A0A8E6EV31_9BACT|nr:SMI1/KNR4 family protein [Telmatocola sphagniphila]QVL32062.1 SMI1/KNR4 family protein [Telmatocola sphagniphila]
MKISDIETKGLSLVLATPKQVESLENELWITFPKGYLQYITKIGEGILGGHYIRIYPPWRIKSELTDWRNRIKKYWFWEKGKKILPQTRALECVILGDTLDGDEIVFHPAKPQTIFILPRNFEKIFAVEGGLFEAIDWLCTAGKLTKAFTEREIVPFDSRKQNSEGSMSAQKEADPPGESLSELIDAGKRWAKRNKAFKTCKEILKNIVGEQEETKVIYEAIGFQGDYPYSAGCYISVIEVIDSQTKLSLGFLTAHVNEGSYGSSFEANKANRKKLGRKLDPHAPG